jgi:hypothetical protein
VLGGFHAFFLEPVSSDALVAPSSARRQKQGSIRERAANPASKFRGEAATKFRARRRSANPYLPPY